jgi:hypothetical protein
MSETELDVFKRVAREKAKERYAKLTREEKDKHNEALRVWKRDHKEQTAMTARKSRYKKRDSVFALLGGKCARCGFTDIRALELDHINGGGKKERMAIGQYSQLLKIEKYLLSHKDNNVEYQCLCANCNIIKKIENNEQYRKYEKDVSEK